MRKLFLIFAIAIVAAPLSAAYDNGNGRSQSYITWDDGGTTVRQGDDGKEVEARANFPLFAGDEVMTSRRGRTEIHLSDGNIIALDRSTDVLFKSILNSYDGDGNGNQTIAELHYGHVALQRTGIGNDQVRLDTDNASYVAAEEAIYAVDADGRGRDRVTVFTGSIEVRTPEKTARLRAGDSGSVDQSGLYDVVSDSRTTDDFERWFLGRSERYNDRSSRYLDSSLAYADPDLEQNGSWVYASSYGGWCWRPYVATGWRPYYYGHWIYGRGGALVWVSSEPWGWVPYHYGRWGYDPTWGWLWFPGISYAPAWVYWMYGPGYVGWVPMGWYDCYRPYYDWAYRPYARFGFGFDYGWYGRVHVREVDLRPWTFVTPGSIVNTRVDHAALTIDAVRDRLSRTNGGLATVSAAPARFTRSEIRDPSAAVGNIVRRGIGGGTGREGSGSAADVTPFFRRDPNLSAAVRERVLRSRTTNPLSGIGVPSGVPTPNTGGTLEGRVNRGDALRRDAPQTPAGAVERGTITPSGGWRQTVPAGPAAVAAPPSRNQETISHNGPPRDSGNWRDRIDRGSGAVSRGTQPQGQAPTPAPANRDNSWRGRDRAVRPGTPATPPPSQSYRSGGNPQGSTFDRGSGSDVPRRVIDRIGGARVYGEGERSAPPRSYTPPPPPPQRSNGGGGGGNSGGSHNSGSSNSGGSHSSGDSGHVKRN